MPFAPVQERPDTQPARPADRDRALRLLAAEIDYVHSPRFDEPHAAETILAPFVPDPGDAVEPPIIPPTDAPAYFAELYRVPLLGPRRERDLFRRMNFLKHRANQLRSRLDPDRPDVAAMDRLETKLADALRLRNDIVRANLRLVVALANGLADDANGFDELVAEGHLPLVRAVELFDVDRGFRFSTYATWAVRNTLHRVAPRNRRRRQRFPNGHAPAFDTLVVTAPSPRAEELRLAHLRTETGDWLEVLEPRDRLVVEARFGLGSEPRPHRFREIAERLGLSTERVRQLFGRALDNLREVADEDRVEFAPE